MTLHPCQAGIGWKTPIYQMGTGCFVKLENLSIGGSHKARSARWMIKDAVESGTLNGNPNQVIIEKSGGNLGIGLAVEANRRGIPLEVVVGLSFSAKKRELLSRYGATLIGIDMLNEGAQPKDVVQWHISNQDLLGKEYVFLDQFKNASNVDAHLNETGPEIVDYILDNHLENKKIYFVGGVGSGASLSGIGLALKSKFESVCVCAVQPQGCDIENGIFIQHGLEGIAVGVKPPILRSDIIDRYIDCPEPDAMAAREWLLKKHGIYCGKSSGANLYAVNQVISQIEQAGEMEKSVVFSLIYDSGDSY